MATRSPATKQRPSAAGALFGSHSTMGACMQTFEWSTSAVGPVADWPASLRMAVSLCLNSQFPTVIFWGPDLVMLYNDAYLPMLADKHPASLGQISTPQIERKHLTLRTRMKRLARKTLCFSNSVFMPDTLIGLLVNRYEFGTPI